MRESTSFAELEKVQKQANKLYARTRSGSGDKAGGSLLLLFPCGAGQAPSPGKLPASLFKDIMGTPQPVKKEEAPATTRWARVPRRVPRKRGKERQKTAAAKTLVASACQRTLAEQEVSTFPVFSRTSLTPARPTPSSSCSCRRRRTREWNSGGHARNEANRVSRAERGTLFPTTRLSTSWR